MTAPASSLGLLLYTQIPINQNKSPEICFLLWKHNKTTQHQSAAYWSQMICPPAKTDQSMVETLARSFSLQTNGLFAISKPKPKADKPKGKAKGKAKEEVDPDDPLSGLPLRDRERVKESIERMDDKIRKMKGIVVIGNASQKVYVVPVPYVPCWELNSAAKAHGEARWVTAEQFYAIIKSDSSSSSLTLAPLPSTEAKFQQLAEEKSSKKEEKKLKKPAKKPPKKTAADDEDEDEEETKSKESEEEEKETKSKVKFKVEEERVPLYLPFASLLRTEGVLEEISSGLRDFKLVIKEGDKKLDPALIPESDQADRVGLVGPDVAKQLAETLQIDAKKKEVTLEVYTCRKCRKLLFTQGDLASHSMGGGDETSTERTVHFRNKSVKPKGASECTSIFINRVSALGEFAEVDGKIFCPKCKCRVGTYNWPGVQCSCGSWVVPALQITKSKVDVRGRKIDL